MTGPAATVSVIIPTHNRSDLLAGALRSLAAALGNGHTAGDEVIVVANACTDDTEARVRAERPHFPVPLRLCREDHANLNVARNAGAAEAKGTVLAFLDDDVLVEPAWVAAVREMFTTHGADVGSGPVELAWDMVPRPEWLTTRAAKLLTRLDLGAAAVSTRDPSHFVGANLSVRRQLWETLGGFHAGLDRSGADLLSGGDTEFVMRAFAAGATGRYHPEARLRHLVVPDRATPAYLAAAAEGRGRTRVALARLQRPYTPVALCRHALAQIVVGSGWRIAGRLSGDRARAVDGLVLARRGMGTLRGVVARRSLADPNSLSRRAPTSRPKSLL